MSWMKGGRHRQASRMAPNQDDNEVRAIYSAEIVDNRKRKFTIYTIKVSDGNYTWKVHRRFSDFVSLKDFIRKSFPHIQLRLPRKLKLFGIRANDESRLNGLETFMRHLFSCTAVMGEPEVAKFFGLKNPHQPAEHYSFIEEPFAELNKHLPFDEDFIKPSSDAFQMAIYGLMKAVTNRCQMKVNLNGKTTDGGSELEDDIKLTRASNEVMKVYEDGMNLLKGKIEKMQSQILSLKAGASGAVSQYESGLKEIPYVQCRQQRYLFSLMLGIQMSLTLSGIPTKDVHLRQLQDVYAEIERGNVSIENWPEKAKREILKQKSTVVASSCL